MREVRTLQQLPSDEVREQGSGLRSAVRASKHRRRWSLIAKDANASIAIPSSVARPTDQEVRWQWRMGAARRCKASAQCMFGRARPFETQARAAKREREGEKQTFTAILVCFDCSNPSAVALDSAAPHHAHGAAAANPLRGAACHWRTEATSVVASEAPARCAVEAQPPLFAARRGHGFRGPTPTARPVLGEVPLQRRCVVWKCARTAMASLRLLRACAGEKLSFSLCYVLVLLGGASHLLQTIGVNTMPSCLISPGRRRWSACTT